MAYDEVLAERVRDRMAGLPELSGKRMFGGIAFLAGGHLTVAVMGDGLLVRVGRDGAAAALSRPGTRPFDMAGRPMRGWVLVDGAELDDDVLDEWIARAWRFVTTLPPKID